MTFAFFKQRIQIPHAHDHTRKNNAQIYSSSSHRPETLLFGFVVSRCSRRFHASKTTNVIRLAEKGNEHSADAYRAHDHDAHSQQQNADDRHACGNSSSRTLEYHPIAVVNVIVMIFDVRQARRRWVVEAHGVVLLCRVPASHLRRVRQVVRRVVARFDGDRRRRGRLRMRCDHELIALVHGYRERSECGCSIAHRQALT